MDRATETGVSEGALEALEQKFEIKARSVFGINTTPEEAAVFSHEPKKGDIIDLLQQQANLARAKLGRPEVWTGAGRKANFHDLDTERIRYEDAARTLSGNGTAKEAATWAVSQIVTKAKEISKESHRHDYIPKIFGKNRAFYKENQERSMRTEADFRTKVIGKTQDWLVGKD